MKNIEVIVITIVIAAMAVLVYASQGQTHTDFKKVCDEAGGATVWDGRSYQCLKKEPR